MSIVFHKAGACSPSLCKVKVKWQVHHRPVSAQPHLDWHDEQFLFVLLQVLSPSRVTLPQDVSHFMPQVICRKITKSFLCSEPRN